MYEGRCEGVDNEKLWVLTSSKVKWMISMFGVKRLHVDYVFILFWYLWYEKPRTSSSPTEIRAVNWRMREGTSTCASQYVSTYACRVGFYIGTVWAYVGFKKYLSKILRCPSVCGASTRVHRQSVTHLTSDRDSRSLISLESHIEDMLTTLAPRTQ